MQTNARYTTVLRVEILLIADGAIQFPHNMKVFNLCRIAKIGVENWAKEEAKKSFDRYYTGKLDSCVGEKTE